MNKILLLMLVFSLHLLNFKAQAVEFGRIVELTGEGFISKNGKTQAMKKGDRIEVGSDIVIEHKGQVTITDNADHRFHLGNASSANVSAQSLELRNGDLWIQSLNKSDTHKIQTANAQINYEGGEAIISYDSVKGKTQLMVINSMMKLSNLRAPELNLSVSEGHFSFVDNAYDEGAPRDPTPVGEKTYSQLVALFNGISPMDKNSIILFKNQERGKDQQVQRSRAIASEAEHHPEKNKNLNDKNNEFDSKMIDDYKNSILLKSDLKNAVTNKLSKATISSKQKKKTKAALTVIHIYGQSSVPTVAFDEPPSALKTRAPASVGDEKMPDTSPETNNPYSKNQYYNDQCKESNKLIDELKKL